MKNFFKLALASALTAVAISTPVKAGNSLEDHNDLWQAIERTGTPVFVNDPRHCAGNWGGGGYYTGRNGATALLICQNNGEGAGDGNQVPWTANDLDTLRHEAQHIVQDCLKGTKGDKMLQTMFQGENFNNFVTRALTSEQIASILRIYPAEDHLIELEAFSVAASVDASSIAEAVTDMCSI